ncbi:hypothetical protein PHISCL_03660 [Aspergillus sclerotialis]|uniref:Hydrophobin n=1 Tax=Aspergillus sclerotialis TaxID=2070753 RepID=A0A3A3A1I1_9EURO|nr:hypothetical protein PHISCL_03660 [Aspergillus sclerotialis]
MKIFAVAATLVAAVTATPSGYGGWGYPGGGRWGGGLGGWRGGWGGHHRGGWGGWGLPDDFTTQHASNVCGNGNVIQCCNNANYRSNWGPDDTELFSSRFASPTQGDGLFSGCNTINIGSPGTVNNMCSTNAVCCNENQDTDGLGGGQLCTALGAMI